MDIWKKKEWINKRYWNNNQSIIILKDEQLKVSKELTENLKIEIKRRKTEGIFYKIGSAIGIITTSILIGIWL